ncbi:hypothetical protein BH24ACT13_BH24ACT13_11360 [soil metagenome]
MAETTSELTDGTAEGSSDTAEVSSVAAEGSGDAAPASSDTAAAPADAVATSESPESPESPATPESTETFTSESPRRTVSTSGGGTGRRKEAVARVRITPGTGQWQINGRSLEEYFPNKVHQQMVNEPFHILEIDNRYDVVARISGGGVSGQAGALRLGISRALNQADEENRPDLKKAGFLTRDARVTERKKYGLKKARKAPQYSKR